jgi:hypothetical protein
MIMGSRSLPKPSSDVVARFSDPRIIEFKPRPRGRSKKPGPVVDPLCQFEVDDRRRRMQQNLMAVLVLTFLVTAGVWLFQQLKDSSRVLACVEAGHDNCLPINAVRGGLVPSTSGR